MEEFQDKREILWCEMAGYKPYHELILQDLQVSILLHLYITTTTKIKKLDYPFKNAVNEAMNFTVMYFQDKQ